MSQPVIAARRRREPPSPTGAPVALLVLLLAASSLALAGCPPRIPRPADGIFQPERLAQRATERAQRARSVRGEAKVQLFTEQGYTPFSQVVAAERPGRLHLEALSPFDVPLAILSTDGDRFQVYSLDEGVFYHGAATPDAIGRLLPIPLSPLELVTVLLGDAPRLPEARRVDWDERAGHYLLRLGPPGGARQTLALDPRDYGVVSSRVEDEGGDLVYLLRFDDFVSVGGLRLPRTLHFEMPSREVDLTIEWKEREVNVEIPPEAWVQTPPRGVPVERIP